MEEYIVKEKEERGQDLGMVKGKEDRRQERRTVKEKEHIRQEWLEGLGNEKIY